MAQPGEQKLQGDLIVASQNLKGQQQRWRGAISKVWSARTGENGVKLSEGRAGWDIGKKLFPLRVGNRQGSRQCP